MSLGILQLPQAGAELSFPAAARSSLVRLPGGAFDQDGGMTHLEGGGALQLRLFHFETGLDAALDALYKELGKGRRLLRTVMRNDYEYRQTWVKMRKLDRERRPGMLGHQPVIVTLEQDYPYWLASADEPVYLDNGYIFDGSWVLTAGHVEAQAITASPHNWTISNLGGARVPRGYILVEPRTGASISNITIANAANGMSFTWTGSLTDADSLEIEFQTKTVKKNGAAAYPASFLPANQADFMVLELGDNAITVTATAISGTVDLWWQWSRHYL